MTRNDPRIHRLFLSLICLLMAIPLMADRPATRSDASDILGRYVAAIGGEKAWKEIANIRTTSETETFGIKRRITRLEEPHTGRFHASSEGPEGIYETGFDGESVWRRAAWGSGILPENDWQGQIMRRWRDRQVRSWRLDPSAYRSAPDETVEGKRYRVVTTTQPDEAGKETLVRHYFDPASGLLERTVRGNLGNALQATTIYSDYRAVGGVRVPFLTISENPQSRSVTTLLEWEANVDVAESLYSYQERVASGAQEPKGIDASTTRVVRPGDPLPPEVAKMIEEARKANPGAVTTVIRNTQPAAGELSESLRRETFDMVWNTINDSYWDPTFGGKDWQAIGDTHRPRAMAAKDSKEFHEVLNEMVNQLGQTHFRVLGPDRTRTIGSTRALPGTLGLSHRAIDGQLVITKVEDDQPAAKGGIETGFVITHVNGRPVAELQAELIGREPVLALRPDAALSRAAGLQMGGDAGGVVELTFLDRDDRTVTKKLTRAERALSTMNRLEFESRWLEEGTIGYVRLSSFFGDAADRLRAALEEMRDAETIIFDLRGNSGGAGDLAPTIAGMFAREAGSLGISRLRHGTREFDYEPAPQAFTGELILLVDGGSASTSEVFAGGLQESGRATIIGSTTRGGVLPSLAALLPTGGALQHVISDFQTPKGVVLEGRGVLPDIEVTSSRADLITGRDPVLDRAVKEAKRR
ncbi:MAG TPA: S41 family peptidase [Thermoanaerobaculia bacterium]